MRDMEPAVAETEKKEPKVIGGLTIEADKRKLESSTEITNNLQLTDRIYVFCPEVEQGFMFYNQSPSGAVAEFSGYLPEGKFWSSGESIVEWDEEINGVRRESYPVTDNKSLMVEGRHIRVRDGKPLNVYTIIVSKNNFMNLLNQIVSPKYEPENGYKVLDFNSKIELFLNPSNIISNFYNNDDRKRKGI